MERVLGEPALVLCESCMDSDKHEKRWQPLLTKDKRTLLIRDVCVRPQCPRLQLCGHLCLIHKLELELSWQGNYSVRACHGCRVNALQLYSEKCNVWFILGPSHYATGVHGVEHRVMTSSSAVTGATKLLARAERSRTKMSTKWPYLRRRSRRCIKQHIQKEQLLALEWSLGNLPADKCKYLWKDNYKRFEMEKNPEAYHAAMTPLANKVLDGKARAEPSDIFCDIMGCRRYAKTGSRCLFHTSK
ncbi:uncharacterized protein PHALS_12544 [Plasmopara halstedii]|uniref:Uncharacterized protein n=1 Tax=Plasmopara halstedii TaxID=4781 RepID=A0A0N7L5S0_PLAHL|nr:uncharacterized protein PHALS_12544 [Plasmopara halstedii]CEG42251.1 hypothetical protein PHALS_12544 [Plasmopara halstedii]|eukprot:XP_024578620.1 hypothetical protein PHALS_12544 [Plasmopara halstedii]